MAAFLFCTTFRLTLTRFVPARGLPPNSMKLFYSNHFVLPLPAGHRFPMEKYALLKDSLLASGHFGPDDICIPEAASDLELGRAHDPCYISRVQAGHLTDKEMKQIGFPWSPEMVERSRRSAGATLGAARQALRDGVAANLAGGTHHAHRDRGEGFCVFNDAAVTALMLLAEGHARRVLIVDADVHQGNGTATILADEPRAYTFSLHGARNFPFDKARSDLDIELPDGCNDAAYLERLAWGLDTAFDLANPDFVIYLAGADPYRDDRFGRLGLTHEGLGARDEMVLQRCHHLGLPTVLAMAGGYARQITDTVAIHAQTVGLAQALWEGRA